MWCLLLTCMLLSRIAVADIIVTDDSGNKVSLTRPATRIISLAPGLTELLYSAGAGDQVAATVQFSDYPAAATQLPRIGDAHSIDFEAVARLQPELIVAWQSGNTPGITGRLRALGYTVYQSEPDTLEAVATTIERLGRLAGTEMVANRNSRAFLGQIEKLRQVYQSRAPIRVFYQFWNQPIYTINARHLISRVIELCGGTNIFAGIDTLTPRLSIESVLAENPAIIIASGEDASRPEWLDAWQQWPELQAVRGQHLYTIPPALILRHTTRIAEGAKMMCEYIDHVRDQTG